MTNDKQYHYFYKITNKVNGHFYYGIHSTKDLNDGYMGSGTRLHYAYKKYGIECFEKEIIAFFDTRKEASKYEAEVVNETLILDDNCYNIRLGGDYTFTLGMVTAKDIYGNIVQIPQKEFDNNPDKYVGVNKGSVIVKDNSGNKFRVPVSDPRYLSGELVGATKGKIPVKDKYGKCYFVSTDDKRYVNHELTPIWKDRHHSEETKQKMRETHKTIKHQQGEKNSQFGTCWITKDGINKKIRQTELDNYISNGWIKGRKIK